MVERARHGKCDSCGYAFDDIEQHRRVVHHLLVESKPPVLIEVCFWLWAAAILIGFSQPLWHVLFPSLNKVNSNEERIEEKQRQECIQDSKQYHPSAEPAVQANGGTAP